MNNRLSTQIKRALSAMADVDHLLIACDFDGTISNITSKPELARPIPGVENQLRSLSNLDKTLVAIISGRSLASLNRVCRMGEKIILIGSHGIETTLGPNLVLDAKRSQMRDDLEIWLQALMTINPGAALEAKPYSLAVHLRSIKDANQKKVLRKDLLHGAALWPEVEIMEGKEVIELAVVAMNKGQAVKSLSKQTGIRYKTVYIGDDNTDETVFEQLSFEDLGIHVGQGPTQAHFKIGSPSQVLTVLQTIHAQRHRQSLHPAACGNKTICTQT